MKKFLSYFLQGLLFFVPLVITLIIFLKLYDYFAGLFSAFGFSSNTILNTVMGLAGTIVFVTILGVLASSYLFNKLFSLLEERLEQIPLIKHIYSPIKDFTSAFVGSKKRFNKPVLVMTSPNANIEEMGFITQEDLKDFGILDKVAVYLPYSYSLMGRLIIVPKEQVKPLQKTASEVMKFIVSGGVSDAD